MASSGHILSNFPEDACCRATGSPIERTLRREDTANFHVLSEGQEYFKLRGTLSVCENKDSLRYVLIKIYTHNFNYLKKTKAEKNNSIRIFTLKRMLFSRKINFQT